MQLKIVFFVSKNLNERYSLFLRRNSKLQNINAYVFVKFNKLGTIQNS